MKSVIFNDLEYQYETIFYQDYISQNPYPETIFYQGVSIVKSKKFGLFGSIETKSTPKEIFRIKADSLNPNLSKDWWKEKISEQIKILERKEELIKGELC